MVIDQEDTTSEAQLACPVLGCCFALDVPVMFKTKKQ